MRGDLLFDFLVDVVSVHAHGQHPLALLFLLVPHYLVFSLLQVVKQQLVAGLQFLFVFQANLMHFYFQIRNHFFVDVKRRVVAFLAQRHLENLVNIFMEGLLEQVDRLEVLVISPYARENRELLEKLV